MHWAKAIADLVPEQPKPKPEPKPVAKAEPSPVPVPDQAVPGSVPSADLVAEKSEPLSAAQATFGATSASQASGPVGQCRAAEETCADGTAENGHTLAATGGIFASAPTRSGEESSTSPSQPRRPPLPVITKLEAPRKESAAESARQDPEAEPDREPSVQSSAGDPQVLAEAATVTRDTTQLHPSAGATAGVDWKRGNAWTAAPGARFAGTWICPRVQQSAHCSDRKSFARAGSLRVRGECRSGFRTLHGSGCGGPGPTDGPTTSHLCGGRATGPRFGAHC